MHKNHQFYWTTTRATFCRWLKLRYRYFLEEGSDPEPAPPYIVVANHGNFFDPWMIGLYFKQALHIMMNDDGFRSGGVSKWYLNRIGAYAKKKGSRDLQAMKKTLSFLKAGEPVLIFPEGQTTWDGETQPIYGGIERMVKRAKVPLAIVRFRGNFLSRPWWAKGKRKGRIGLRRTVIPVEQLQQMSDADILEVIKEGIYSNDILDEQNQRTSFKGDRLAEGLERLVWICPSCAATDSLSMAGDEVRCGKCRRGWTMDPYCRLHEDSSTTAESLNLHDWVAVHKDKVRQAIQTVDEQTELIADESVGVQKENDCGIFVPECTGTLTLTRSALSFTELGESRPKYRFPVSETKNYVIQQKDVFEVTFQDKDYRFDLSGRSPMKWLMYFRYLNGFEKTEKLGVITN